jgi:hypothetical protein
MSRCTPTPDRSLTTLTTLIGQLHALACTLRAAGWFDHALDVDRLRVRLVADAKNLGATRPAP